MEAEGGRVPDRSPRPVKKEAGERVRRGRRQGRRERHDGGCGRHEAFCFPRQENLQSKETPATEDRGTEDRKTKGKGGKTQQTGIDGNTGGKRGLAGERPQQEEALDKAALLGGHCGICYGPRSLRWRFGPACTSEGHATWPEGCHNVCQTLLGCRWPSGRPYQGLHPHIGPIGCTGADRQ
jgi:hypothetical protein